MSPVSKHTLPSFCAVINCTSCVCVYNRQSESTIQTNGQLPSFLFVQSDHYYKRWSSDVIWFVSDQVFFWALPTQYHQTAQHNHNLFYSKWAIQLDWLFSRLLLIIGKKWTGKGRQLKSDISCALFTQPEILIPFKYACTKSVLPSWPGNRSSVGN